MRILHIIGNLSSGGAEKLLEQIVPLMNKKKNFDVELYLLSYNNNIYYKNLKNQRIKIHISKYKGMRNPMNILGIVKFLNENDFDIIHTHLFPSNYWGAIAKFFLKKDNPRFITTVHNTHNRRRNFLSFKYIEKFIYSKYDQIICISEPTRESLLEWIDYRKLIADKTIVISNGVNIEKFKKAKHYSKKKFLKTKLDNINLVCMVGRFSKQKDQDCLIKALTLLPENTHLVLVGEGEREKVCKNLALMNEVENRVHFLGFRNDISRILKTIDVFVLSSHWEGFGLVVVEAMASHTPVIASDVPGVSEVVNNAGLLFEKSNHVELAKKIMFLINDESAYKSISSKCALRAKQYSLNSMIENYNMVYENMME